MSTNQEHAPATGTGVVARPEPDENGIVVDRPIADPGVEPHVERYSDVHPGAERLATAQIVGCFAAATLLALVFVVVYFWPGLDDVRISFLSYQSSARHFGLGLTLGLAILLIGIGVVQWARLIMSDEELVEERHPVASSDAERAAVIADLDKGIAESGLSRRRIIGASLLGAVGLTTVAPLVTLLDAGPWPLPSTRRETIERTLWAETTPTDPIYLVNDVTFARIRAADVEIGQLINAEPSNLEELHGTEFQVEKAKAAIIIVRMNPNSIRIPPRRQDWHVGGILAYSKICTHVGCPISLWEQQTHHLLCPCHQSTFDLGDGGKVVFGPAARALPQLPITVDDEGFLIARSDFTAPVGPSYFERDLYPNDKAE